MSADSMVHPPTIPDDVGTRAFAEPWQAEAFALAVALNENSTFEWREWVEVFSSQPGDPVDGGSGAIEAAYYRRWLSALEAIAVDGGLVSASEIDSRVEQWRRAYLRTPHGQPIELARGLAPESEGEAHDHDHHHHDDDHQHHAAQARPVAVSPATA